MSALVVQKFGGTSVGTPERIRAIAARIARARDEGQDLVVVVSAMGQTTDELIALAQQVSEQPTHREMDMLLTAGERISMALLSMALADCGVSAISLTGSQSGIITDGSHRRARIQRILGDRVRHGVAQGKVVIVAGFQGVSESKEITTLGRGGSDTTAVALAVALEASACEIYTDVDGVYSADPRIVPEARLWRTIPHDLMVEMATRGAGVLHPRSVELAKQYGVRLRVRSSLNSSEGTEVVKKGVKSVAKRKSKKGAKGGLARRAATAEAAPKGMEEFRITGVTLDRDRVLLLVHLARPTVLGALWDLAAQNHLSITAPFFVDGQVQCFVERDAAGEWKKSLERLSVQGFIREYELKEDYVPVSVVGDRFSQDGSAMQEVIETLASSQIPVTMGSASALAVTLAVPAGKADDAVRALHGRFFG